MFLQVSDAESVPSGNTRYSVTIPERYFVRHLTLSFDAAKMLRLNGNRAHHALCAVESVQTDKSLDPLKRHLSHALVVDIRAGKLRANAALKALDAVLFYEQSSPVFFC